MHERESDESVSQNVGDLDLGDRQNHTAMDMAQVQVV